MKTPVKYFLTLLIALVMCLSVVSVRGFAENTNSIDSIFSNFINDPRWCDGTSWGSGKGTEISSFSSSGCCAYCADFTKYCFDIDNPRGGEEFYDPDQIRAGDVINIGGPYTHWFAVLGRNGNNLYTAEGNYCGLYVRVSNDTYYIDNDVLYGDDGATPKPFLGWHFMENDTQPPIIESPVKVSAVSESGFTLAFTATDNAGIQAAYAKVWEYGQSYENSKRVEGTISNNTATVRVDTAKFGGFLGDYYIACGAADAAGNYAESILDKEISLYRIDGSVNGTYAAKQDTDAHDLPYEEVNGKNTTCLCLVKGKEAPVTGAYTNEYGAKYYQLGSGKWVYADNMAYRLKWSDIWEWIINQFFYLIGGQPVSAASKANTYVYIDSTPFLKSANSEILYVKTCTVRFDADGGIVSDDRKAVPEGAVCGALPVPYRFGYNFDGWFTASGEQITAETVVTGDLTAYAHWTRIILLQGSCGDDLAFILYGDGVLDITGSGTMKSHPWTNNLYRERILKVILPEKMTALCNNAFIDCTYLYEINIPEVKTIPQYCFSGCKYLPSVDLPDSVTSVETCAFAGTGLETLTLPKNLTSLSTKILDGNTGVTSINIPAALSSENYVFNQGIHYNAGSKWKWGPFTGSAVETAVIESGKTYINAGLFINAANLSAVIIPDTVKKIGKYAFFGTDALESIRIPDSVNAIDDGAFACSGIVAVLDRGGSPKTLDQVSLGNSVFFCCKYLKEIRIGTVPYDTFNACFMLEKLTITEAAKIIGDDAFLNCTSLTDVYYSGSLAEWNRINISAYNNEALTKAAKHYECTAVLTLPAGLKKIASEAFMGVTAEVIVVPEEVAEIGSRAFAGCENLRCIIFRGDPDSIDIASDYLEGCKDVRIIRP